MYYNPAIAEWLQFVDIQERLPMTPEELENMVSQAGTKHSKLFYQYAQIIDRELGLLYDFSCQALWNCYEKGCFTSNITTVQNAQKAVDELEKACQAIATRWEAERKTNPPVPYAQQKCELTREDKEFIVRRRAQLQSVAPEKGRLDCYFETGSEGSYWSFEVDGLEGYDSLRVLEQGDRLVVYNSAGSVVFDEIFIEDHESGWVPYQSDAPYGIGQQLCGGLWVHWIPKGKSSAEWAVQFAILRKQRAELYRLKSV